MNSKLTLKLIIVPLFSLICFTSVAQPGLSIYTDAGRNNVSHGVFINSAILGHYKYGKNKVSAGFLADLKNYNNGFSGFTLNASRFVSIKDNLIELKAFYTRTYPTAIFAESNWGILLQINHKRFEAAVGSNFRTYSFSQQAVDEYNISKNNSKVHEIFNLMYRLSYYVKPTDNNWNVCLSITNIDYFVINQETNPVLNLSGMYKISSPVSLYFQAWYKCSGVTNLELNHFGYFFRAGIIWDIL